MNILILGTSNSILKNGYVSGLKRALPNASWTSLSSGASPGIQFSKYAKMDFTSYDLVVLDSVPNDEQYALQTPGYSYNNQNKRILLEVVSTISSQTKLIVLGIAIRDFFAKPSAIYTDRENLANNMGAQFIDFSSLLKVYQYLYDDVYSNHPAHPKDEISNKIGYYLGVAISHHYDHITNRAECVDYSKNFEIVSTHLNEGEIRNYKNSLTEAQYLECEKGNTVSISTQKKLIGFFVNGFQTNTFIQLTADNGAVLTVPLLYKRMEKGFLNLFAPLATFQTIKTLTVVDQYEGVLQFKPRMTTGKRDIHTPKLQLGSFIHWDSEDESNLTAYNKVSNSNHLVLSDTVKNSVTDEVLKAIQASYTQSSGLTKIRYFFKLLRFKHRFKVTSLK